VAKSDNLSFLKNKLDLVAGDSISDQVNVFIYSFCFYMMTVYVFVFAVHHMFLFLCPFIGIMIICGVLFKLYIHSTFFYASSYVLL
jgi:hypothetical protein